MVIAFGIRVAADCYEKREGQSRNEVGTVPSCRIADVSAVDGDTVYLEEYNRNWDNTYSTRTIAAGSVLAYLYPP